MHQFPLCSNVSACGGNISRYFALLCFQIMGRAYPTASKFYLDIVQHMYKLSTNLEEILTAVACTGSCAFLHFRILQDIFMHSMLPYAWIPSKLEIWQSLRYVYRSEVSQPWGNAPILHGTSLNAPHHRFLMVFKLQHLLYYLYCLQTRDSYSTYMYLQSLGPDTAPNERGEQELQPKWPRKAQYPGAGCSHQILMGAVTEAGPGSWSQFKVPSSATKLL